MTSEERYNNIFICNSLKIPFVSLNMTLFSINVRNSKIISIILSNDDRTPKTNINNFRHRFATCYIQQSHIRTGFPDCFNYLHSYLLMIGSGREFKYNTNRLEVLITSAFLQTLKKKIVLATFTNLLSARENYNKKHTTRTIKNLHVA